MDSITQAVLGASLQGALLGRWQGRKALLYGAMLGTLPDMDVVIDYGDAVANMTYHRGFSHSLLVVAIVSVLLAWLVRRFRPHPDYSGLRLWLCIWLVLTTHVLLDAFTTYGTQLFWPFTTPPVAISSIFIIDPLYTVPLLAAVIIALAVGLRRRLGVRAQYAALGLSTLYLLSTLAGKQMAEQRLDQALTRAGIEPEAVFVSPTPFNTVLWRLVAVDGDDYYEGLTSWLDRNPPRLERLPRRVSEARAALADSPQHQRLRWFTNDLLRYDLIDGYWVVTDVRLGMTGYHPFRFALSRQTEDGTQELIDSVEMWPAPERDLSGLRPLWHRALNEHYPLSLGALASGLSLSPGLR
ncbi:metal-dependent hydrolase [Halopseudomonas pertucinogena]|uniref:Integral membrane protein n=1 Tax=Halopseudomonas pertucinogena TaxID=86175 RepID=A0ABQ2CJW1_9GAMM|nr:metal-dependent hydrolase [Halopseudomonas pertucinogena]GGI91529.1 integral membrane protein [Halopseudomonas pertucinogena]